MRVDVLKPMTYLDGSIAKEGVDENARPVTARRILIDALMTPHEGDVQMSGAEKIRLVKLALRIDAEDNPEFTAEDAAFLVARVDKMCPPLTVYRMREIIDPASL